MSRSPCTPAVFILLLLPLLAVAAPARHAQAREVIQLRAWGIPGEFEAGPLPEAQRAIIDAFRARFPGIEPVSTTGLTLGPGASDDMIPFMQIAGDIAPDVMYVNFRQSQTYIDMKLLYPLDRYVEQVAGVHVPDGPLLDNQRYIAALQQGPGWTGLHERVPDRLWPVMRRRCPLGSACAWCRERGLPPADRHYHIWAFPAGPLVIGMVYDRALFAEAGIEQRTPRDWDELLAWAKLLTDPRKNQFGIRIEQSLPAFSFMSFLNSAGGEVVREEADGNWRCTLDSDAAVEAAYFFARLRLERVSRNGRTYRGVISGDKAEAGGVVRYGMEFSYLDDRFVVLAENQSKGFGPVPLGPGGRRGSELNSQMLGIFSGLSDDPRRRDAAWDYILFFDGPEARKIRTQKLVAAGMGEYVRAPLLRELNQDGRYNDILQRIPPEWEQAYQDALRNGVPEPYGKNCQYFYEEMSKPLGAIWGSDIVRDAIDGNRPDLGKAEIRRILQRATARINEKMLGQLPPEQRRRREALSWLAIIGIVLVFAAITRRVLRAFSPPRGARRGQLQLGRYGFCYLLLLPALLALGLWMYWPMLRGSVIAFQNYSVVGDSTWAGAQNFADVLFDAEFWHSLGLSLLYAGLFVLLGFWTPIALALLLQEVPRASALFRVIYYLPAVLSGVVVVFLWRTFYRPDGLLNHLLNPLIRTCNALFNTRLETLHQDWLQDSSAALLLCLLPTIWAGVGPGCLIYLAALKTVPDELYEAAEIDGAGLWRKVFSVALPSIRALVAINFIGAVVGAIRGASPYILAMTAGGPYDESGGATEVVGLKLFYTTFGQLKFGAGAAMAWVLGAMLVGFTVLQLQRLSRVEFRTADPRR